MAGQTPHLVADQPRHQDAIPAAAPCLDRLLDCGWLPDAVIRAGIRRIVRARLVSEAAGGPAAQASRFETLVESLRREPVAARPDAANAQHYALPPEFFERVLGPHLKYSCAFWGDAGQSLAAAETRMLEITAERAAIEDGQQILELGCGWGSLTLFLAGRYPRSRIVAVSNSAPQRAFILARARERGLTNVDVVTADINDFDAGRPFDRIVSVEMFEHVRNYPVLFDRVAHWLAPDGRLFIHVFAHRRFAYPFEAEGASDWMARHFFTGGMMPSADLFLRVQSAFDLEERWLVDGRHYQRTAEAWLRNMDREREAVDAALARAYGADDVARWRVRWRVFFMACAEMFGYDAGRQWIVAHYRFRHRHAVARRAWTAP